MAILEMLPPHPRKISTTDLLRKLMIEGFNTSLRTVQRDLKDLTDSYPLICDDENPAGWSVEPTARRKLPDMDGDNALAFAQLEQHLLTALPPSSRKKLEPYFRHAQQTLTQPHNQSRAAWQSKIRFVRKTVLCLPAQAKPLVMETLYQALYNDTVVEIGYHKANEFHRYDRRIHPCGVVFSETEAFLIGRFEHQQECQAIRLHHIESARDTLIPAQPPHGFDLDAWLAAHQLQPSPTPSEAIILHFEPKIGIALLDTKLTEEQRLECHDDRVELYASVAINEDLIRWIMSFGAAARVIQPLSLRQTLLERLQAAVRSYQQPTVAQALPTSSATQAPTLRRVIG
ncbi:WYL domain-containing protein [Ferrimonas pelagia]|uniref:WYL domain-containing protein n=2 Tax=Ferrimonas pelagia TaxID=1177826 RepID=A0ABP9FIR9_9GAMM